MLLPEHFLHAMCLILSSFPLYTLDVLNCFILDSSYMYSWKCTSENGCNLVYICKIPTNNYCTLRYKMMILEGKIETWNCHESITLSSYCSSKLVLLPVHWSLFNCDFLTGRFVLACWKVGIDNVTKKYSHYSQSRAIRILNTIDPLASASNYYLGREVSDY